MKPSDPLGLPAEVRGKLAEDFGQNGIRSAEFLDSAVQILGLRESGPVVAPAFGQVVSGGGRLAESAAYCIREALASIAPQPARATFGVKDLERGLQRFLSDTSLDSHSQSEAGASLAQVVARYLEDRDARGSLPAGVANYFRARSGGSARISSIDPADVYSDLLKRANNYLHGDCSFEDVTYLFDDCLRWFSWVFVSPDERLTRIAALAMSPFAGEPSIVRFGSLILNWHHLRHFFANLSDPAWLNELADAEVLKPSHPRELQAFLALTDSLGKTQPEALASTAEYLFDILNSHSDRDNYYRELARVVSLFGEPSADTLIAIARRCQGDAWVQDCSEMAIRGWVAEGEHVTELVDVLLQDEEYSQNLDLELILGRYQSGLTRENALTRLNVLVCKVRKLVGINLDFELGRDLAALNQPLDPHPAYRTTLVHSLALVGSQSLELGVDIEEVERLTGMLPRSVAGRLLSTWLTASDMDNSRRMTHLERRFRETNPTGDDIALVSSVLSSMGRTVAVPELAAAVGYPPALPVFEDSELPEEWLRAWNWSAVFPAEAMGEWSQGIKLVTDVNGPPPELPRQRQPAIWAWTVGSPFSADKLSSIEPLAAAALVAAWRPSDETAPFQGTAQLSTSLGEAVQARPDAWTEDPIAVVKVLREPMYIASYFEALAVVSSEIEQRAEAIIEAVKLAKTIDSPSDEIENSLRGDFGRCSDISHAVIQLVEGLARTNASLGESRTDLWTWISQEFDSDLHGKSRLSGNAGAADQAINRPAGKALTAGLHLAGWEHRHDVNPEHVALERLLARVPTLPEDLRQQLEAIIAINHRMLEVLLPGWLEESIDQLFANSATGPTNLLAAIDYSSPSPYLVARLREPLRDAAQQGHRSATQWLAWATLMELPGFATQDVITMIGSNASALGSYANYATYMVQDAEPTSSQLKTAIELFETMLAGAGRSLPSEALETLGRWAFVKGVPDTDWLDMMKRLLEAATCNIELAHDIAQRCAETTIELDTLVVLRLLLDRTEGWQRTSAGDQAIQVLAMCPPALRGEECKHLRNRLLELGFHSAQMDRGQ